MASAKEVSDKKITKSEEESDLPVHENLHGNRPKHRGHVMLSCELHSSPGRIELPLALIRSIVSTLRRPLLAPLFDRSTCPTCRMGMNRFVCPHPGSSDHLVVLDLTNSSTRIKLLTYDVLMHGCGTQVSGSWRPSSWPGSRW